MKFLSNTKFNLKFITYWHFIRFNLKFSEGLNKEINKKIGKKVINIFKMSLNPVKTLNPSKVQQL